jgi:phospholipase C
LSGAGACGNNIDATAPLGRCRYGQRLPLLVISPYAKVNYVDHSLTDQTSILQFIEDNWSLGRIGGSSFDALAGSRFNMFEFEDGGDARKLLLDPATGLPH